MASFPIHTTSLLYRAIKGERLLRPPVWLMRQAGRYLPEYRAIRKTTDFLGLCQSPELAAMVTIQPVDLIGSDAAILFSDILIPFLSMGLKVTIEESVGPRILNPVLSEKDLAALKMPRFPTDLQTTYETIERVAEVLHPRNIPVIGFAGAPWTLATYAIEGKTSKQFSVIKKIRHQNPKLLKDLLFLISEVVAQHLIYQIKAGASAVQLFDSWAGALSPNDFQEFAQEPAKRVFELIEKELGKAPATIYFPNGASESYESLRGFPSDAVGIDWHTSLQSAKAKLPGFTLQGNLEPMLLYAPKEVIQKSVQKMLASIQEPDGSYKHYVANLGHGILPDIPPENAKYFIDLIKGDAPPQ